MKQKYTVKEYDTIMCNEKYKDDDRYVYMEEDVFNKLSIFIDEFTKNEEDADVLDFLRKGYRRDVKNTITFKNYVGLIQMNNGVQIEILPKIDLTSDEGDSITKTKKIFLDMLRCLKEFPGKSLSASDLKISKMNLYEIFISMYLQEVRQLVKKGIKSSYVTQEDNLNYFKGKLLVNKQIKHNLVHQEKFYVGYEEFLPDRPENRLIKSTLVLLKKITTSASNSKEISQLLTSFDEVSCSKNYSKDFSRVNIDRNMMGYKNLMIWSKVFLMNKGFTTFAGDTISYALLFPMETVYESYIAKQVTKVFSKDNWKVRTQAKDYRLFEDPKRFLLKPDIVLKKDNKVIIMDTKWKRLNSDSRKNYGISQTDMYQMYAYSKKYHTSEIYLLYPINDDVRNIEPITYDSGDGTSVYVWFVEVEKEKVINNLNKLLNDIKEKDMVN